MKPTEFPPLDTAELLKPANDNPWYCLATLHGEQPVAGFDEELAVKNRNAWNEWIDTGVDDRTRLAKTKELFARRSTSLELPKLGSIADFSNTHFDRRVNFDHFQFNNLTDFSSSKFSSDARFCHARFKRDIDFSSATFSAEASFPGAHFGSNTLFKQTTFSRYADYEGATLHDADFSSAKFFGTANFEKVTFFGALSSFSSVIFSRDADFHSAKFKGPIAFDKGKFSSLATFASAVFSGSASFRKVTFSDTIIFINTEFAAHTSFADARFENLVPDFRGATMHDATEWHGAIWPKPSRENAQDQVYAYQRLKQEMERLKKHEDELTFIRKELRARRGLFRVMSGAWLLNFVYWATSDYGDSIVRPLLSLAVVFAVGTAVFMRLPASAPPCIPTKSVQFAAKISASNILVFLPDKRELLTPDILLCWSDAARITSAAQSLLGVVLLFLVGLAIRNRFRMK